jgi:hypothetical protein
MLKKNFVPFNGRQKDFFSFILDFDEILLRCFRYISNARLRSNAGKELYFIFGTLLLSHFICFLSAGSLHTIIDDDDDDDE